MILLIELNEIQLHLFDVLELHLDTQENNLLSCLNLHGDGAFLLVCKRRWKIFSDSFSVILGSFLRLWLTWLTSKTKPTWHLSWRINLIKHNLLQHTSFVL